MKIEKNSKEPVRKMCLTAGVSVGVMGDQVGPGGNLQVYVLAPQDLAGVLQQRCQNCFFSLTFE